MKLFSRDKYVWAIFTLFIAIIFLIPIERGTPLSGAIVSAQGVYEHNSPVDGELIEFYVKRGDSVVKGDPLYKLRSYENDSRYFSTLERHAQMLQELKDWGGCNNKQHKQICDYQSFYKLNKESVVKIREFVVLKKNNLEKIKKNVLIYDQRVKEAKKISEDGLISRAQVEDIEKTLNDLSIQRNSLSNEIQERLNNLVQELEGSTSYLKGMASVRENGVVVSEFDGFIYDLPDREKFIAIKRGMPVVKIATGDIKIAVQAKLPVKYSSYVSVGSKAEVRVPGPGGGKNSFYVDAKVVSLSPEPSSSNQQDPYSRLITEKQLSVYVILDKPIDKTAVGTQVQVLIPIGRHTIFEYMIRPFVDVWYGAFRVL